MIQSGFSWTLFHRLPVVGILRGFDRMQVEKLITSAAAGGLCNFEVTMNSQNAADLIRMMREILGGRSNVGAGTVCSLPNLEAALEAGAGFIVTPIVNSKVIIECVKRHVPVFPGALSPTEIHQAFDLGASIVKVFPSDSLGPTYIKSLKGPFPGWRLMPTGGVTVETLGAYKRAGAEAFGVGSPLFDREQVLAGKWGWVEEQTRRFAQAYAVANL
jgi:2-dehydro-3-deoxyphosphogluconate aldolase / (4S)-4-hydroxy-2-oxoglutarate aldolase